MTTWMLNDETLDEKFKLSEYNNIKLLLYVQM